MKLYITLFALNFLVVTASAGTPDQDPIVASLRYQFSKAHTPLTKELQLQKTWTCMDYVAVKNNYEQDEVKEGYIFKMFDGIIINDSTNYPIKSYAYSEAGLVGIRPPGASHLAYDYLRITSTGDLIAEFVTDGAKTHFQMASSISKPSLDAQDYTICPLDKVH